MRIVGVGFLVCTLWAASAHGANFTLSDEALMTLDYDHRHYYYPRPTASVTDRRDVPGPGVEFNIHFQGTSYPDDFLHWTSSRIYGAGALAGIDVSAYACFDLMFTLLEVDGSSLPGTTGFVRVGAYRENAFNPQWVTLRGQYYDRASVVSTTCVNVTNYPVIGDIGFYVGLWDTWTPGEHNITLRVEPAPGSVQIPEPGLAALFSVGGLLVLKRRRRNRGN